MKKLLAVAAFLIVPLAGCATPGGSASTSAARTQMVSGTYYCWKDKLNPEGDALVCNWEGSVADACRSSYTGSIGRSTVASGPRDAGRCANGQWLVQVTTK